MRIVGRTLRASTLAERRVLKSLGFDFIRVPRRLNPFAVARVIRRISFGTADMQKLKMMLKPRQCTPPVNPPQPAELPDSTSAPVEERAA